MNSTPPRSSPPSLPLAPLLRDQRKSDRDHLTLLRVFHFVVAGFAIVGLAFLSLHWFMMHTVFSNPEIFQNAKGPPPPPALFAIFKWFYVVAGTFMIGGAVANFVSAICIGRRRGRMFSLIVAGVNCIAFPIGTTLGVFTFVVLLRDSVVELYDATV